MNRFQIGILAMVCYTFLTTVGNCEDESQLVSLFDGMTLDGWQGATEGYTAEDGMLVCREGAEGNLLSEREFGDFVLRFEFRLTPGANNGLAIRAPSEGHASYDGMELQIIDNTTKKYGDLLDYQYHGSLYGVAPAKRGHQKPVGEWNVEEVRCQGRRIQVILNDVEILNFNLDDYATDGTTIDKQPHPGLVRPKGHVGFLSHGDKVFFRSIRIHDLSSDPGG